MNALLVRSSIAICLVAAGLWIVYEIRHAWRCPRCGRLSRSSGVAPAAFCARCGAPRPRGDRRTPVPLSVESGSGVAPHVTEQVRQILATARMAESLPSGTRATARVVAEVPPGTSIAFAHPTWKPETVPALAGLPPFPRRPPLEVVPAGIVRVDIDAVERTAGGMSSMFGFEGIYVSALVSLPERAIWDVRATDAS